MPSLVAERRHWVDVLALHLQSLSRLVTSTVGPSTSRSARDRRRERREAGAPRCRGAPACACPQSARAHRLCERASRPLLDLERLSNAPEARAPGRAAARAAPTRRRRGTAPPPRRRPAREPRLAGPARAGSVSEPHVVAGEQRDDLGELALAAEERRRRHGQVRPVEALQRRKLVSRRAGTRARRRRGP